MPSSYRDPVPCGSIDPEKIMYKVTVEPYETFFHKKRWRATVRPINTTDRSIQMKLCLTDPSYFYGKTQDDVNLRAEAWVEYVKEEHQKRFGYQKDIEEATKTYYL